MNEALRQAANNYNEGLHSADEFLANVITVVGERWTRLKETRVDHATRDTALDVDTLADNLSKL